MVVFTNLISQMSVQYSEMQPIRTAAVKPSIYIYIYTAQTVKYRSMYLQCYREAYLLCQRILCRMTIRNCLAKLRNETSFPAWLIAVYAPER